MQAWALTDHTLDTVLLRLYSGNDLSAGLYASSLAVTHGTARLFSCISGFSPLQAEGNPALLVWTIFDKPIVFDAMYAVPIYGVGCGAIDQPAAGRVIFRGLNERVERCGD